MPSTSPAHRPAALRPGASATAADAVLAVVLFGTALVLLAHGGLKALRPAADPSVGLTELPLPTVALVAVATLPLVLWRRSPLAVFLVTAAASVALVARGDDFDLALGAAVALYLVAAHREPGPGWSWTTGTTASTTAVVVGFFLSYVAGAATAQGSLPVPELFHTGLAWAAAWFAGERTRLRHVHIAELHERAVRAEREAEGERRLAAAEERARIARDLHDSAGHAINVIAVRAGAARLRHPHDPERSLQALEAIEDLARQTAADIDQIVGTLRDAAVDGDDEVPPRLASLDTLVTRHTAAGLDVTVEASGTVQPLSDPADRAAFRILQEALTNAARHGSGPARVGVAYGDRAVELTVTNPMHAEPATRPARPARPGGGNGLVGMRERATLLGGDLDAGRVNGGFRVRARIPYTGRTVR